MLVLSYYQLKMFRNLVEEKRVLYFGRGYTSVNGWKSKVTFFWNGKQGLFLKSWQFTLRDCVWNCTMLSISDEINSSQWIVYTSSNFSFTDCRFDLLLLVDQILFLRAKILRRWHFCFFLLAGSRVLLFSCAELVCYIHLFCWFIIRAFCRCLIAKLIQKVP